MAAACSLQCRRAAVGGRRPPRRCAALSERLGGHHRLHPRRLHRPPRDACDVIAQRGIGAALVGASASPALLTRLPAYPSGLDAAGRPGRGARLARGAPCRAGPGPGRGRVPAVQRLDCRSASPICRSRWSSSSSFGAGRSCASGRSLAIVLLAPVFGTLLAACAAAAFGRRRAPLVAAWTAVVTYFVRGARTRRPRTRRSPAISRVGADWPARLEAAGNPVPACSSIVGLASMRELALPGRRRPCAPGSRWRWPWRCSLGRLEARLWLWSLAFSTFYILGRVAARRRRGGRPPATRRTAGQRRRCRRRQRRRPGADRVRPVWPLRLRRPAIPSGTARRARVPRSVGDTRGSARRAPAGGPSRLSRAPVEARACACRERSSGANVW